jgi:hypothetical protein
VRYCAIDQTAYQDALHSPVAICTVEPIGKIPNTKGRQLVASNKSGLSHRGANYLESGSGMKNGTATVNIVGDDHLALTHSTAFPP